MDKPKSKKHLFFNGIKRISKWAKRLVFIILAAIMLGLSNAFYNESRWINDTRNFDQPEQVIDNEDPNE